MRLVQVAVFIVILIGGLIDTAVAICSGTYETVSYTHLDVYKRQLQDYGTIIPSSLKLSNEGNY